MLVAGGSTNVTTYFAMRLAADGTAATGLTATNFDLQYVRSGAAPSTKVDASAGTAGGAAAHSDNTVVEPDATDQPGLYRVDWPDAAFAAGVREVILTCKVATAFTEHLRVEIDGEVNVVEWAGTDVVAGAIPAFAADAAGGLPVSDAGGLALDTILDAAITTRLAPTVAARTLDVSTGGEAGIDWANVGTPGSTVGLSATTLNLVTTTTTATTATDVTTVNGLAANVITAASMNDDASTEIANKVWDTDATGRTTTGTFGAAIGDPAANTESIYDAVVTDAAGTNVAVDVVAVKAETALIVADTNELQTDWTNAGRLDTILDTIATDTTTDIPALIATAQADLDTITGAAGALLDTTATSAQLVDDIWDEPLTGATHNVVNSSGRRLRQIQEAGGYSGGAIYVDTVNGVNDSTDFEAGVETNPVDGMTNANILAASLNISTFVIAPGSTITLGATQANQVFKGASWTLNLGSQNIDGSTFVGATVAGIATNTSDSQYFIDCNMGAVTLPGDTHCVGCGISGTQTVGEATADYFWDNCHSAIAGAATPALNIGSNANVNINWRHYSGGLQVDNAVATTTMSYESDGQLVIAATCTSLTVSIRGNCSLTDSGTTSSITDDARYATGQLDTALTDIGLDHLISADLPTNWATDVVSGSVFDEIGGSGFVTATDSQEFLSGLLAALTTQVGTAGAGLTDLGGMSTAMKAEVNAEMDTALDTAISELGVAAPSATPTLRTAVMLLYMALRNNTKVDTTGTDAIKIHNDAGTQITSKLITDDGTDYNEAKMT